MDNPFQIFKHPDFGKVRVIIIDGVLYFVGKDVAKALGYKDHKNALKQHVDAEDKMGWQITTPSRGKQTVTVINESGLYALTFASKLEKAKKFRRWVTNEVLPSIRKTGSYSLDAQTAQLIPAATVDKSATRRAAQLAPACVYVTLLHNNDAGEFVKVGHSGKPRNRIAVVKRQTNSVSNGIYLTSFMPRKAARLLEWLIQENFSSRRMKGEFFSADFEKVCAALNVFAKVVMTMPLDEKFAELKIQVKVLADTDEAWAEIDRQYNLLLEENIFCKAIE